MKFVTASLQPTCVQVGCRLGQSSLIGGQQGPKGREGHPITHG